MAGKEGTTYTISFEGDYGNVLQIIEKMKKTMSEAKFSISPEDTNELSRQINFLKSHIENGFGELEITPDMDEKAMAEAVQKAENITNAFGTISKIVTKVGKDFNKSFDVSSVNEYIKKIQDSSKAYSELGKRAGELREKQKQTPDSAPDFKNLKESEKEIKSITKALSKMQVHANKDINEISYQTLTGFNSQLKKVETSVESLYSKNIINNEQYTSATNKIKEMKTALVNAKNQGYDEESLKGFKKLSTILSTMDIQQLKNLNLDEVKKSFQEIGATSDELEKVKNEMEQLKKVLEGFGIVAKDGKITNEEVERQIDKIAESYAKQAEANKKANDIMNESAVAADNAADNVKRNVEKTTKSKVNDIHQTKKVGEAYDKLGKKVSYIFGIQIFNMIRQGLTRVVREATTAIMDLDESLTEIATVTGRTRESMWNNFEELNKTAKELGVTTQDVVDASVLFYRQGKSTAEVMDLVRASTISAGIASMETAEASNRLTAALNGFRLEASDAMDVADKFAALAANSASSFEELSMALTKNAAASYSAGIDMDHMLGYLAAVIETTREAPTSVGTAFKTIIARAQQLKEIGEVIDEETGEKFSLNRVDTALREIGVELTDSTGQLRDLQDVIGEIGPKWNTLNRNQKAYIATMMAGTRMQSRFFALMNDYDRTLELISVSQTSVNAATEQFNTHIQGLEANVNKLKATLEQLYESMANSGTIQQVLGFLTKITEGAVAADKAFGLLNIALLLVAAKGFTSFLKVFTKVAPFLAKLPVLTKTTSLLAGAFSKLGVGALLAEGGMTALIAPIAAVVIGLTGLLAILVYGYRRMKEEQKVTHEYNLKLLNLNETFEDAIAIYERMNDEIDKNLENNEKTIKSVSELQEKYNNVNTSMEERIRLAQLLSEKLDLMGAARELGVNFSFGEDLSRQQLEMNEKIIDKAIELKKENNLENIKIQIADRDAYASGKMQEDIDKLDEAKSKFESHVKAVNMVELNLDVNYEKDGIDAFSKQLDFIINTYEEMERRGEKFFFNGKEVVKDDIISLEKLKQHLDQLPTEQEKITFIATLEEKMNTMTSEAILFAEKIANIENDFGAYSLQNINLKAQVEEIPNANEIAQKIFAFSPEVFNNLSKSNNEIIEDHYVRMIKDISDYSAESGLSFSEIFDNPQELKPFIDNFVKDINKSMGKSFQDEKYSFMPDLGIEIPLGMTEDFVEKVENIVTGDLKELEQTFEASAVVKLNLSLENNFNAIGNEAEKYREEITKLYEAQEQIADGQDLTKTQVDELIEFYPDLRDSIESTSDGYIFQEGAIENLRKTRKKDFDEKMDQKAKLLVVDYNSVAKVSGLRAIEIKGNFTLAAAITAVNEAMEEKNSLLASSTEYLDLERAAMVDHNKQAMVDLFLLQKRIREGREVPDKYKDKSYVTELATALAEIDKMVNNVSDIGDLGKSEKDNAKLKDYFYMLEEIEEKEKEIYFLEKNEPKNISKMVGALKEKQELLHQLNTMRKEDLDNINKQLLVNEDDVELLEAQSQLKKDIHATSTSWWSLEDKITSLLKEQKNIYEEIYNERKQIVESAEEYILQIIEKRIEEELKLKQEAWEEEDEQTALAHENKIAGYEKELSEFEKMIEGKKNAFSDQYDEEDYQEGLDEKQREITDTQAQIARLSLRDDAEAVNKRIELQEKLVEQQKDLSDYQRDYEREQILDNLDDQEEVMQDYTDSLTTIEDERYRKAEETRVKNRAEWTKDYEERYTIAKKYELAHNALIKQKIQVYEDGKLATISLEEAFKNYENTFGKGMSIMGEQIKKELIDNLRLAKRELNNLKNMQGIVGPVSEILTLENSIQGLKELANIKSKWQSEKDDGASKEELDKISSLADLLRLTYGAKTDTMSLSDVLERLAMLGVKNYIPQTNLPSMATGSSLLKEDMSIYAHRGEAIVPSEYNPFNKQGFINLLNELNAEGSKNYPSDEYLININVDGVVDATIVPNLTSRIEDTIKQVNKEKTNERRRKQLL